MDYSYKNNILFLKCVVMKMHVVVKLMSKKEDISNMNTTLYL